jgi:2-polyprenyl-3-methyl-5-hydroxy-6-metoxy-1,4-benzoquinol methylase
MISTLEMTKPITSSQLDRIDYISRWREMVESRQRQIDERRSGYTEAVGWTEQVRNFHNALARTRYDDYGRPMRDPFLAHVAEKVYPRMTVLDVGAGTGRFAIALARQACHLIATEPSAITRQLLTDNCAAAQLGNVRIIASPWPAALAEAGVGQADITICSHVLYPISEIQPFIAALEQATQMSGLLFLYLRAGQSTDSTQELWGELYDEPLTPQPDYLDAYNVLAQIGIAANVTIVKTGLRWRFDSLDDAVAIYQDRLCVRPGDNVRLRQLRHRLRELLVEEEGALLMGRAAASQSAIMWWQRC